METLKPIRLNMEDPVDVGLIVRANSKRKQPLSKESRALRELALERARQIDDFGDVPMVPAHMVPQTSAA